jgi:IclR family pca regulon transcriptional regulator
LRLTDIAEELEMSQSTAHRYVTTLVVLGFLELRRSHMYRLGLSGFDLGMAALRSTGLSEHAQPLLEELRGRTSYTASLAVLDGAEILYVGRAQSWRTEQRQADLSVRPGSRLPSYCTAMGKILLAHLPEDERYKRVASITGLTKHTPKTITSKKGLHRQLKQIKETGFAINDEELKLGLHSISAPVHDESRNVVAAVSLVAQTSTISLEDFVEGLRPDLMITVSDISARLGCHLSDEQTGSSVRA